MIRAFRGRLCWVKTKKKYGLDDSPIYVLLFPDSDHQFNEVSLKNIDNFLKYRKGQSVVILTTDDWVYNNANKFSVNIQAVERITKQDYYYYNCYHYYYYHYNRYYSFSEQFIMMSLQGDYGKRLSLAENVHGITKEDMACLGLYVIRSWGKVNG